MDSSQDAANLFVICMFNVGIAYGAKFGIKFKLEEWYITEMLEPNLKLLSHILSMLGYIYIYIIYSIK